MANHHGFEQNAYSDFEDALFQRQDAARRMLDNYLGTITDEGVAVGELNINHHFYIFLLQRIILNEEGDNDFFINYAKFRTMAKCNDFGNGNPLGFPHVDTGCPAGCPGMRSVDHPLHGNVMGRQQGRDPVGAGCQAGVLTADQRDDNHQRVLALFANNNYINAFANYLKLFMTRGFLELISNLLIDRIGNEITQETREHNADFITRLGRCLDLLGWEEGEILHNYLYNQPIQQNDNGNYYARPFPEIVLNGYCSWRCINQCDLIPNAPAGRCRNADDCDDGGGAAAAAAAAAGTVDGGARRVKRKKKKRKTRRKPKRRRSKRRYKKRRSKRRTRKK